MFDAISIVLIFIALLDIGLGFFVLLSTPRNRANTFFGLFAFSLAIWTVTMIGFRVSDEWFWAMVWMRAAYIVALFIGLNFWCFAYNFPTPKKVHPALVVGNGVVVSFFCWLIWSTPILVRNIKYEPWGKSIDQGPFGWYLYALFFLGYFAVGHLLLVLKYLKAKGLEKIQLRFVFSGVFLGGEVFGVLFNLFLPSPLFNQWRLIWVGPLLTTIFMLPIVGYAFVRHKLMNVKVITAQIFALVVTFLAFINIFTFRNSSELVLKIAIFMGILISSAILIGGVVHEVKRREEMEELTYKLEEAYAKLKEVDQAKTDFLSLASHQLRSPLTVIRVGVGALLDGTFGAIRSIKQKGALQKVFESADRLIQLISEYLDISRIELGKMQYEFASADLGKLVSDIVEEYTQRAEGKGLTLTLKSLPKLPPIVMDSDKLRQVISNLIDNAIKYTPKGSITVELQRPGLRSSGGQASGAGAVRFSITDTGYGLSTEDIAAIFEKFKRRIKQHPLRRGEHELPEGSGLGLHVAKMFIEAHGGKIGAESPGLNQGSTFYFSLNTSSALRRGYQREAKIP